MVQPHPHPRHPEYAAYTTEEKARASIPESLDSTIHSLDFDFTGNDLDERGLAWDDVAAACYDLDSIHSEAITELECDCLNEHDEEAIRGEEHGTFWGTPEPDPFWKIADRHTKPTPSNEEI